MKDLEYAESIEEVIKMATVEEERLNYRLGLKVYDCCRNEKYIEFELTSAEWQKNPYGGIHGGVICSFFDTCMGIGAVAYCRHKVSTTEISVSYLRPLMADKYILHAEYTHFGRTMIRCMGKICEKGTGKVCATAMASFAVAPDEFGTPQV